MSEPYTAEVEERNIKLNLDLFTQKEEFKILYDEKGALARKNAILQ